MMASSQHPKNPDVFNKYARYYDALYGDKDYKAEAEFVLDLAKCHGDVQVERLLDIGCGTGGHLLYFAQAGLSVTGLDVSEPMVRAAVGKIQKANGQVPRPWNTTPSVKIADVRSFKDRTQYDCAVAMFAVIGYLTSNPDLLCAFRNIRGHLRRGACFIFDVWFGPAAYAVKPENRIKEIYSEDSRTIRLAVPKTDAVRNVIRVNYTILELKGKKLVSEVNEVHEMRFFFLPELEFLLDQADLKMIDACPFMEQGKTPAAADWNISVVAKAI
jgi:SAM-dependent methyltransferase